VRQSDRLTRGNTARRSTLFGEIGFPPRVEKTRRLVLGSAPGVSIPSAARWLHPRVESVERRLRSLVSEAAVVHSLSHREHTLPLIDVLPPAREQLAAPTAREDCQSHHRPEPKAAVPQATRLFVVVKAHFFRTVFSVSKSTPRAGLSWRPPFDRHSKDCAEHIVNVIDGLPRVLLLDQMSDASLDLPCVLCEA
jgi:hypothetical protein